MASLPWTYFQYWWNRDKGEDTKGPWKLFYFLPNRILLGEDHDKVKEHLKYSSENDAHAELTGIVRLRVPFSWWADAWEFELLNNKSISPFSSVSWGIPGMWQRKISSSEKTTQKVEKEVSVDWHWLACERKGVPESLAQCPRCKVKLGKAGADFSWLWFL